MTFCVLSLLFAGSASAQTPGTGESRATRRATHERLSVQATAGVTVHGEAQVISGSFGYAPQPRFELLLNAERVHEPVRVSRFPDGFSVSRGGTFTFVSVELRWALRPMNRVSPFVIWGGGAGEWRANVNTEFPDRVRGDLRVVYLGGGVRVPLRAGISLLAEALHGRHDR